MGYEAPSSTSEALRRGLVLLPPSALMLIYLLYILDLKEDIGPRNKERFLFESPCGSVGFIGGVHEPSKKDPKRSHIITPITEKDLFKPPAALFLDLVVDWGMFIEYPNRQISEDVLREFLKRMQEESAFYGQLIKFAFESNTPIILGDAPEHIPPGDMFILKRKAMLAGITLDSFFSLESLFRKQMTRRDLLRWFLRGAAAYLMSSDIVSFLRDVLGIRPTSESAMEIQARFSDLNFPEFYVVTLRNIVWALKVIDMLEQGIFGKDKIINIVAGLDHRFIGIFLNNPERAKEFWKKNGYAQVIRKMGPTSWITSSLIFYPQKGMGRIEHPSLVELIEA